VAQKVDGPIEYEQPPVASAYAIRRGFRLLILITLVNTVLLALNVGNGAGFQFVQKHWTQWRQARLAEKQRLQRVAQQRQLEQKWVAIQQQCAAYAAPAGQVVYEEDPARAAGLLAKPDGGYERLPGYGPAGGFGNVRNSASAAPPPRWQPPARAKLPAPYAAGLRELFGYSATVPSITSTRGGGSSFSAGFGGGGAGQTFRATDGAVLFMHGRIAPNVGSRLVVVRLATSHLFSDSTDTGRSGARSAPAQRSSATQRSSPSSSVAPTEPAHVYTLAVERVLVADAWALTAVGSWSPPALQTNYLPLLLPDATRREVLRLREPVAEADIPPVPVGNAMRFFAGQADPNDESHFTIDYELDGRPGTIDGYLWDAGVVLTPRVGQSVFIGRQNAWDLTPSPAGATTAPDRSGG
jgi:hypothetical protein